MTDERTDKWHTGPDVADYVELNRAWAIKWMKAVEDKSLLANALRVFIKAFDGDLDGLLIAKLNAQSVLKKLEGGTDEST
tara:strand:- start:252 stop:491 length:240 start_codon:yes stop_codon:yes gene_type:complete